MMTLEPSLIALAERLIATKRQKRNVMLREDLRHRESESRVHGTLGAVFYAQAQMDACTRELSDRVDAVWTAYRRVIADARIPWSPALRNTVIDRVREEAEADIGPIEEMARDVIVRHGHGFALFLRDAWPDVLARVSAEVDLFGLRQRAIPTLLGDQLASPRYTGPAAHWSRAQTAQAADPPDLMGAAREAVHTVEGLAKVLTGLSSATLGDCIKALRSSNILPSAVARQLEFLWGHSSNVDGLRHGSASGDVPGDVELLFVIESAEVAAKILLRLDRSTG